MARALMMRYQSKVTISLERSSDLSNSGEFKKQTAQKLQPKSIVSCEIVQIHSLFRHGFIKKPK